MTHLELCKTSEELKELLSVFFSSKVFQAMIDAKFAQPTLMKSAAYEAFVRFERYKDDDIIRLRNEILFLEQNGQLAYSI